jgi:SAM-dependent methyltransferase
LKNEILQNRNQRIKVGLLKVADRINRLCDAGNVIAPPDYMQVQYGGGSYYEIGLHFFRHLLDQSNLRRDSRVLDVGCGIGRMALPLAFYLGPDARYEGFDIMPDGIEYCSSKVTPAFPNFRFQVANVFNSFYNPNGTIPAERYAFPYADASFDVVFSTSVFTHLPPNAVAQYLRETARVLAPGGKCLHTCFALDDEALAGIREGRAKGGIVHQMDGFMTSSRESIEDAIAIPEGDFTAMYAAAGLNDVRRHPGSWSGRKGSCLSYQDIWVATKG